MKSRHLVPVIPVLMLIAALVWKGLVPSRGVRAPDRGVAAISDRMDDAAGVTRRVAMEVPADSFDEMREVGKKVAFALPG